MDGPIISVSGLRGIIGETLTPEVAMRYVSAFAAGLPDGLIVVSRDGRNSGRMLSRIVCGGLQAAGRDVLDCDVAATPTTGTVVREHSAVGGIQISASHNPPEYNGLKLFSSAGRVIGADAGTAVLRRYQADTIRWQTHDRLGSYHSLSDPHQFHLDLVLKVVDVERIRRRAFKVLLDSNHGAGSQLGQRLLEKLGCETEILGAEPDGQFEHPPEPTAANLADVRSRVTQFGADIGFCQDPDADRLAVIDEAGRYIGEEYTLALCLDHVLRQKSGVVVTNCATSRMSQDVAESHKATFFRSAVGEANVADMMIAKNAVFGGEGNGGPIDPRVGYVRDSFVGMALILDAMAAREQSIAELANVLPRYEICKSKTTLHPTKIASANEALQRHFAEARADLGDGLRLDWPDRWLLVRPSNTEPIVRVIAEAAASGDSQRLCDEAIEVIATVPH